MFLNCVTSENTNEMLANMSASTTLEEFYPAIAIATLMRIIRDPTLWKHHTMVVQAITFIFKSLGIKCVPFIQQVIPAYLSVIRGTDPNFREVSHVQVCDRYTLILTVKYVDLFHMMGIPVSTDKGFDMIL